MPSKRTMPAEAPPRYKLLSHGAYRSAERPAVMTEQQFSDLLGESDSATSGKASRVDRLKAVLSSYDVNDGGLVYLWATEVPVRLAKFDTLRGFLKAAPKLLATVPDLKYQSTRSDGTSAFCYGSPQGYLLVAFDNDE